MEEFGLGSRESHMFLMEFPRMLHTYLLGPWTKNSNTLPKAQATSNRLSRWTEPRVLCPLTFCLTAKNPRNQAPTHDCSSPLWEGTRKRICNVAKAYGRRPSRSRLPGLALIHRMIFAICSKRARLGAHRAKHRPEHF